MCGLYAVCRLRSLVRQSVEQDRLNPRSSFESLFASELRKFPAVRFRSSQPASFVTRRINVYSFVCWQFAVQHRGL